MALKQLIYGIGITSALMGQVQAFNPQPDPPGKPQLNNPATPASQPGQAQVTKRLQQKRTSDKSLVKKVGAQESNLQQENVDAQNVDKTLDLPAPKTSKAAGKQ